MITDAEIEARIEASKQLGFARGRYHAALEIGGRIALELLQADREAWIDGEAIREPGGGVARDDEGRIVFARSRDQQRLDAYDKAIAQLSIAFGSELQDEIARRAATAKSCCALPGA